MHRQPPPPHLQLPPTTRTARSPGMSRQAFITTFARRICRGCIDFEPARFRCPPEVVVTLAGVIQQFLLQLRSSNAHPIPGTIPDSSHPLLLNRILTRFALAASASHARAKSSDEQLRIYYPGRLPKTMPLQKLTTTWIESGAVRWTHKGRLAFNLRPPQPALAPQLTHPPPHTPAQYLITPSAQARITHRGHPLSTNALLATSARPPPPSFKHRLDLPSNSATASYQIHAAVTG